MLKAGSISMRNARRPVPGKNVIRGAIENRGLDTQGLVAVGDGIFAKHGRDCYVKQSDSNHSARDSHRRGLSQSRKYSFSQAARRYR